MIRTTFHIVLGSLLWVVFGYYWYLVMQQPVTDETKRALMIVGAIVAFITIVDALWIGPVELVLKTQDVGWKSTYASSLSGALAFSGSVGSS